MFYLQVVLGIVLGVILGHVDADLAVKFKPVADAFIALIKMLIGPMVFFVIVSSLISVKEFSKVGKISAYAMLYFMIMTAVALLIGGAVAHIFQPGNNFTIDLTAVDPNSLTPYLNAPVEQGNMFLALIPRSFVGAFVDGNIPQILILSILFAFALSKLQSDKRILSDAINSVGNVFFKMIEFLLKLAPLSAFAAMAFSVGYFGLGVLWQLFYLLACFYITCFVFIFGVLGVLLKYSCGISMWKLIWYLREELLIVIATVSSDTVLPRLMQKLENLGAEPDVVRLVLPMGYSCNLDGSLIYFTLAALFIAQATQTDVTFYQFLWLCALMYATSKGSVPIPGGAIVALASTLAAFNVIPVEGILLILGIDRFLAEARVFTNVIGNCAATLFIASRRRALKLNSSILRT